jgi:hypothetical protein
MKRPGRSSARVQGRLLVFWCNRAPFRASPAGLRFAAGELPAAPSTSGDVTGTGLPRRLRAPGARALPDSVRRQHPRRSGSPGRAGSEVARPPTLDTAHGSSAPPFRYCAAFSAPFPSAPLCCTTGTTWCSADGSGEGLLRPFVSAGGVRTACAIPGQASRNCSDSVPRECRLAARRGHTVSTGRGAPVRTSASWVWARRCGSHFWH